ncbi:MAG: hypothetical protein HOV86_21640 [Thermoactinospora sp.]|nr:hypothetical protein [Thermoactinospora sp.]
MTIAPSPPAATAEERGRDRRWFASSWIPAGLAAAAMLGLLLAYGVTVRELAAFTAHVGLGIALPGTLLWRAFRGHAGSLPGDIAAGLALGYAVETLTYIAVRAVDLPLLVLVWPVTTIVLFATVPKLRRHWRSGGPQTRVPATWAWALSGVVTFLVGYTALRFFRLHGLSWPGYATPYVDMPYHLSLLGELRNHVPPTVPGVLGERLSYHWFVYAEMAATGWVTGIETQTLVYRLSMVPMVAATLVLVAMIARSVTGRWWAGPVAIGLAYLAYSPALTQSGRQLFTIGAMLNPWLSPTQTFGALLFAPAAVVLIDLLRRRSTGPRAWLLLSLLLLALAGAKATFLPLIIAGLVFVAAIHLLTTRRLHRLALLAMVPAGASLVIAQAVIFGGAGQGMAISPLSLSRYVWGLATGIIGPRQAEVPVASLLVLAAVHLVCIGCIWGGLAGLLRRDSGKDPAAIFFCGLGMAAVCVAMTLGHPGLSQMYFVQSARPYLSIAAVYGMLQFARWSWAWTGCVVGAGAALVAAELLGPVLPVRSGGLWSIALPYLALTALALTLAVCLLALRKPVGLALVTLLIGFAVPTSVKTIGFGTGNSAPTMARGALQAGRWLRQHSHPDDIVATNAHCRTGGPVCDSRSFWVSAYTERRVLVEGWAYSSQTLARTELFTVSHTRLPFWDQQRLRDNDEAFRDPARLPALRSKYGVKWLLVDTRRLTPHPAMALYAQLRFRSGRCLVYELAAA